MRLQLPGRPPMDVRAIIEDVEPGRLFTWRGHVAARWLFEGYRSFTLQPLERDRTRVTHLEDVHGVLAPIFGLLMGGAVAKSQRELNDALRRGAEAMAARRRG